MGASAVLFSPDGAILVVMEVSLAGRERLSFGMLTPGSRWAIRLHVGYMHSVAFSLRRALLATASGNERGNQGEAQLWDAATRMPIGEPLKHGGQVWAVAFSPDGAKLATAGFDNTARLWDVATRKQQAEPLMHQSYVNAVAFSPDGLILATASREMVQLWDVITGARLGEPDLHDSLVWSVAFSPDGTKIATTSVNKTAQFWDTATRKPLGAPLRHYGVARSVVFSPDGTRLATASDDHMARLWIWRQESRSACCPYLASRRQRF